MGPQYIRIASLVDPAWISGTSTHTLDCEDVGLNSLLVLEGEGLARIAEELGLPEESAALRERTLALAARVQGGLWDPDRRVFANRLWSGRFVRSLAPTSFYPMAAGIATPEQAEALVREHLVDAAEQDFPGGKKSNAVDEAR